MDNLTILGRWYMNKKRKKTPLTKSIKDSSSVCPPMMRLGP